MDSNLRVLISRTQIAQKVQEAAIQVQRDYTGKDLVIVMVMKGAICIVADLIRELDLPFDIEFVQCSSYGAQGMVCGPLEVIGLDRLNIHNRDVLIIDDIFDSGNTLSTLTRALAAKHPRSIKSLVLLSKNVPHITDLRPDYVLFHIDDHFVIGYGLDYKDRFRGLDGVYELTNPQF